MTGHAMGSETETRMRLRENPIPFADSITVSGTPRSPTMALPITGMAAKNASMMNEGTTPKPNGTMSSASNARDGIVSATRLVVSVSAEKRGRRWTAIAMSTATTVPTRTV